jgi:hypothetical protein
MLPVPVPRVAAGELGAVARDLDSRTGCNPAPELEAAEFHVPYIEPEAEPEDAPDGDEPTPPAPAAHSPIRIACESCQTAVSPECPDCGGSGVELLFTFQTELNLMPSALPCHWVRFARVHARSAVDAVRHVHRRYPHIPIDRLRPASLWSIQGNAAIERSRVRGRVG